MQDGLGQPRRRRRVSSEHRDAQQPRHPQAVPHPLPRLRRRSTRYVPYPDITGYSHSHTTH